MINTMGTILLLSTGLLFYSIEDKQSPSETEKAQLCRFYVANFNLEQQLNYVRQRLLALSTESNQEGLHPHVVFNKSGPDVHPGDPKHINLFTFRVYKYQRKFLDYDVFLIYPSTTHALPYKLGLDDEYNFVRLWGFYASSHTTGDSTAFHYFDDGLSFNSTDLPIGNETAMSEFVYDWIQLTQFYDSPWFFKLRSNEYTLIDEDVLGSCTTVEKRSSFISRDTRVVYRDWKYKIPKSGQPVLKLHEQREDSDRSVFDGISDEFSGSADPPKRESPN